MPVPPIKDLSHTIEFDDEWEDGPASREKDTHVPWLCQCGYKHIKPYDGLRCKCGRIYTGASRENSRKVTDQELLNALPVFICRRDGQPMTEEYLERFVESVREKLQIKKTPEDD